MIEDVAAMLNAGASREHWTGSRHVTDARDHAAARDHVMRAGPDAEKGERAFENQAALLRTEKVAAFLPLSVICMLRATDIEFAAFRSTICCCCDRQSRPASRSTTCKGSSACTWTFLCLSLSSFPFIFFHLFSRVEVVFVCQCSVFAQLEQS